MSDHKYCRECGTKKVEIPDGKFNVKTGEPLMKSICGSKDPCACGDHILEDTSGWRARVFGEYKCKICNHHFSALWWA